MPRPPRPSGARSANGEIKRRTEVVGIFPHEDAIVGAILLKQDDELDVQRARYLTLETIAPLSDDPTVSLPAIAGRPAWSTAATAVTHITTYTTPRDAIRCHRRSNQGTATCPATRRRAQRIVELK
jgi:hypothetical protein